MTAPNKHNFVDRLSDLVTEMPVRTFYYFLALHFAVWTLIPTLVRSNLPLDILEQLAWGKEWQLVFYKHPPLPAWITEIANRVFGGHDLAFYALSPAFSCLAMWAAWRLAFEIVGPRKALLSVLILEGVYYFTYTSPEFNHNMAQMGTAAMLAWLAYRSLRGDGLTYWIGAGIFAALCTLSKYSVFLFILPIFAFIIFDRTARRSLVTPGPYLAILAGLVVLSPHLHALWAIDFLPFRFPFERALPAADALDRIWFPVRFALGQAINCTAALILIAVLAYRQKGEITIAATEVAAFDRRFVFAVALGPLAIAVLLAAVTGMKFRTMWGAPMWSFIGLFGLVFFVKAVSTRRLKLFTVLWLIVFAYTPFGYAMQHLFGPYVINKVEKSFYPGNAFAKQIDEAWREKYQGLPLRIVIGDVWTAGNVAFYSAHRPSVMFFGDPIKNPWIDLDELRRYGAVIVKEVRIGADVSPYSTMFPNRIRQPDLSQAWETGADVSPVALSWWILAPAGQQR